MTRKITLLMASMLSIFALNAQQAKLELHIVDASGRPLPGAVALLKPDKHVAIADANGKAVFAPLHEGKYVLEVSFLGFETFVQSLSLPQTGTISVVMNERRMTLDEVRVTAPGTRLAKPDLMLPSEMVNRAFVKKFYDGTLASTLERLPGVSSIRIGMGHSKPMIRGMAFNRILVVEDGMRHESQQWGDEHGLETDVMAAEKIELIRGPSSVRYGSDAIGGVLRISGTENLHTDGWASRFNIYTSTVNAMLGSNALLRLKNQGKSAYLNIGWWNAADMKVPADSADVYNFRLALPNRRLRNTAGSENSIRAGYGFQKGSLKQRWLVSILQNRQGFFANAHGIEPRNADTLLHDRSQRDVQMPYHKTTHLKFIQQTEYPLGQGKLSLMLGYQKSLMNELSPYVNHGFMPPSLPENLQKWSTLERHFDKDVISLEALWELRGLKYTLTTGLMADGTRNRIGGWAFVFPEYRSARLGSFAMLDLKPGHEQTLQLGLRLDGAGIFINEYRDWFPSPGEVYILRVKQLNSRHINLTGSAGYRIDKEKWTFGANLGKSFRLPTAAELGANGVNYHMFRFEQGNPELKPETSWQLDAVAHWKSSRLALEISPFAAYSPNYIYLNPTPDHDYLYGNGNQNFIYTQNKVFRAGGELHIHFSLSRTLMLGVMAEGLYSSQRSGPKKGFGLPLSPPASFLFNINYSPKANIPLELAADLKLTSAQNRIVPPEQKTPAWYTLNLRLSHTLQISKQNLEINLQLNNLTNNAYLNHLSYYRRINLPEAGRNLVVMLSIPFNNKKNHVKP